MLQAAVGHCAHGLSSFQDVSLSLLFWNSHHSVCQHLSLQCQGTMTYYQSVIHWLSTVGWSPLYYPLQHQAHYVTGACNRVPLLCLRHYGRDSRNMFSQTNCWNVFRLAV